MKVTVTSLPYDSNMTAVSITNDAGRVVFDTGYSTDTYGNALLRIIGDIQRIEAQTDALARELEQLNAIRGALAAHYSKNRPR